MRSSLLAAIVVLLCFAAWTIVTTTPPQIETTFGGATVDIRADRGLSVLPGQCVTITWDLEGIQSLYIDGHGKIGWGEMDFCPTISAPGPVIKITAQDGSERRLTLNFHYLLKVLVSMLGFVGMASAAVFALYGVLNRNVGKTFPLQGMTIAILALLLIGGLIRLSDNPILIRDFLLSLKSVFANPDWHLFGSILAALIYLPLIVEALRHGLRSKRTADFLVIGGFLLFVFFLYLPFGFESIGQWEEWFDHAWLDGQHLQHSWMLETELFSRFWRSLPQTLAYVINSESFVGYHLLHFLVFWGKLVLLYGILRKLGFNCLNAFLITMLYTVYPVNSALMSLRSLHHQYSVITLLAAVYLLLDYQTKPGRLSLLGMWLGLLLNVGSYESAYGIILVIPLLCWLRDRQLSWRNFKLSALWYMFPVLKVAYLLLLLSANLYFYGSTRLHDAFVSAERIDPNVFGTLTQAMMNVYRHTFLEGWQGAARAMGQNTFMALTVVMLLLVGGLAWFLSRRSSQSGFPYSPRQLGYGLIIGLAFIVPSVGVLIWLEGYNDDPWRLYTYVPIGAAIAVFSLIALLTVSIANVRHRNVTIVMFCLILMFPAVSHLLLQHEYFVESANNKARVLAQLIEQAPQVKSKTHLILLTDMTWDEMRANKVYRLHESYVLQNMFYVLYQDAYPAFSSFCQIGVVSSCEINGGGLFSYDAAKGFEFRDLLVFRLYNDLSVELLNELPGEFDFTVVDEYHPNELYNPEAPLPPRAITMLGASPD